MQLDGRLFDISKRTWQSFSSEELVCVECELAYIRTLPLPWFYCYLSDHKVIMLGIDSDAGYRLAADMLNEPVETLSVEDQQDAVAELVNCIGGQLDRDHPANEYFGLPGPLALETRDAMLNELSMLSDVAAKVGGKWIYIALFKDKRVERRGGFE